MDKPTFIKQVQELVGEAETEKALDLMLEHLGKEASYINLYNQTLQAKSLFNKTEKDEAQGVISNKDAKINYNQVTKQILQILGDLNKEEKAGPGGKGSSRRVTILSLALILLLSAVGYVIYKVRFQNTGGETIQGESCPDYKSSDSAFKVLILPFRQRVASEGTTPLDLGIAEDIEERLDVFKVKYKVNIGLGVKEEVTEYPNTSQEADKLAKACAANLVIWGAREQVTPTEDIITTRYKFIDIEQFSLKELVLASSSDIDTISSQTSIVTDGQLTEAIEKTLQYIFGIIAHETGHQDVAIANLSTLELEDSDMNLTKDMFLADALLQSGDSKAAKQKYTEVLEKKPDYWLARNNRAAINFQEKEYFKAAQDFTIQAQEETVPNPRTIIGEGISLFKAGNQGEALEKLEKVAQMDTSLRQVLDTLQVQLKSESIKKKSILENSKIRPKSPTADLDNLKEKRSFSEAELHQMIKKDPKKGEYWSELLIRLYEKKDLEGIRQLAQKAKDMGVEEVFLDNPIAEKILSDRRGIIKR
jgi:tetratricopeptide (TPR) repeat protein